MILFLSTFNRFKPIESLSQNPFAENLLFKIELFRCTQNGSIENYTARLDLVVHVQARCATQHIPKVHSLFVGFDLYVFDVGDLWRMCRVLCTICIGRFDRIDLCSDQHYSKCWYYLRIYSGLFNTWENRYDFQKFGQHLSIWYVMTVAVEYVPNQLNFTIFQGKIPKRTQCWPARTTNANGFGEHIFIF